VGDVLPIHQTRQTHSQDNDLSGKYVRVQSLERFLVPLQVVGCGNLVKFPPESHQRRLRFRIDRQFRFDVSIELLFFVIVQSSKSNGGKRNAQLSALFDSIVDQKRLKKIARYIADAISGYAVDIKLNFLEVTEAMLAIRGYLAKQF
jgi:hypothetical protein